MHEMSLVRNIVNIVLSECEGRGVSSVRAVRLTIGEMHDVVDRYVPDLFRYLARGTIAADAEVSIERIPTMVQCNQCGATFHLDAFKPETCECPQCHAARDYRLCSGLEFRIDSIEVDGVANEGTGVSAA